MPDRTAPHAVLVEGVECAGKTTLIRALRERLDWDCKALSHRPAHQFDRFMGEYLLGRDVVFNRGHYSELVYSRLWGREEPFSTAERAVLTDYASRHFLVVHCTADLDTLRLRYERRGYAQRARSSELARILELFEETFAAVPHLRYASNDADALAAVVERLASRLTNFEPRPQESIA